MRKFSNALKSAKVLKGIKKDLKEHPRDVDEDFATSTSLHGITHFITNKSITYKLFWGTIFFTCMAICIWQVSDNIVTYFSYPTNVVIEVNHSFSLPFPAITICRAFRYDANNTSDLDVEFFQAAAHFIDNSEKYSLNQSDVKGFQKLIAEFYNNITAESFNFTKIYLRSAYTINKETLKDCRFDDKRCYPEDFHLSFNQKYEFCWTFKGSVNNNLIQTKPGSTSGFKFSLDLKEDEYVTPLPSGKLGYKLFFHSPDDYPYIFGTGYGFGPGLQSRAIISYRQNTNLKPPHGKCNPEKKLKGFANYSLINCLAECEAKHMTEVCGCRPIYYQDTAVNVICDILDKPCLEKASKSPAGNKTVVDCQMDCQVPCEENYFDVSLSYVEVLDNKNLRTVLESYEEGLTPDYVRKNYVYLNAYYENFISVSTQQKKAMSVSSLLGNIGGQMGLFMGISTLTMVEVFEYFGRRLLANIQYSKKKAKMKDENATNPSEESSVTEVEI